VVELAAQRERQQLPDPGEKLFVSPAAAMSGRPPMVVDPSLAVRLSRRQALGVGGVLGVAAVAGAFSVASGLFGRRAGAPTAARPVPPRGSPIPGTVLWQTRSGAEPLMAMSDADGSTTRIVVDRRGLVVTSNGSQVFAMNSTGRPAWRLTLPAGVLGLRQWGDAVLVTDARRLWLLDAATGEQRFAIDPTAAEAAAPRGHNPDGIPIRIRQVVLAADRAFVSLDTATTAIDRRGRQVWRWPRQGGPGDWHLSYTPRVADGMSLLTQNLANTVAYVGLCDAGTGTSRWSMRYELANTPPLSPPPSGWGGRPPDDAWQRSEGRIGSDRVVLRDTQQLHGLRLSDGASIWQKTSAHPIAGIEIVEDLLVVATDVLTAYAVDTGERSWQVALRGGRIAVPAGGNGIVVATEDGIRAVDTQGGIRWWLPMPEPLRAGFPDRLTTDGHVAYLTLKPRLDRPPPTVDVLAVALGGPR
jgi:outer membrane protein assembly factor BamB